MTTTPPCTAPVRLATLDDLDALVQLRGIMLTSMGVDTGGPDAAWRTAAIAWLGRKLGDRASCCAVVADVPGQGVVACAVGLREEHLPSPSSPSGGHSRLVNVATVAGHRRHGHARECVNAVLSWFAADTDVRVVNLNATPEGAGMYRALGFAPPRFEALQRRD